MYTEVWTVLPSPTRNALQWSLLCSSVPTSLTEHTALCSICINHRCTVCTSLTEYTAVQYFTFTYRSQCCTILLLQNTLLYRPITEHTAVQYFTYRTHWCTAFHLLNTLLYVTSLTEYTAVPYGGKCRLNYPRLDTMTGRKILTFSYHFQ